MEPSERMRLARRYAGLSQSQLAQRVGVQRSAVSHWESPDGKSPNVAHLREVAMATGVQFEWLVTGRGAMQISPDLSMDSVPAAVGLLIEDDAELRLIRFYRNAALRARVLLIEFAEMMAAQRKGMQLKKRSR
jgi:transcriptional regulator with XRE-family HTH domain